MTGECGTDFDANLHVELAALACPVKGDVATGLRDPVGSDEIPDLPTGCRDHVGKLVVCGAAPDGCDGPRLDSLDRDLVSRHRESSRSWTSPMTEDTPGTPR